MDASDPARPGGRHRYTLDGDAAVEARIARDQATIAGAVTALVPPAAFRGLVLMGGYGRGEGGYRMRNGVAEPFNDYDYFVVVRGLGRAARQDLAARLAESARALEEVGVEVDFALLRAEGLRRAPVTLMNAEMLWGHRVVAGDPGVLGTMPAMPFEHLPPGEITRLMLNRGSLLLMNQRHLAARRAVTGATVAVFFKYLFKAILACGDARLAGSGAYHPSYVRKLERLREMDEAERLPFMGLYSLAWKHRFHPDYARFAEEDAAAWQARVARIWLDTLGWFEAGRLLAPTGDWSGYCTPTVPKGQGGSAWRNAAVTLRDFGAGELLRRPRWSLRYPRERLISALPLLLEHPGEPAGRCLCEALAMPRGAGWDEAAARFLDLWRRFA